MSYSEHQSGEEKASGQKTDFAKGKRRKENDSHSEKENCFRERDCESRDTWPSFDCRRTHLKICHCCENWEHNEDQFPREYRQNQN